MACRASGEMPLRATNIPRVKVDLPSILPPEYEQRLLRQRLFLPLRFDQVDLGIEVEGAVQLFAHDLEGAPWVLSAAI